MIAEAWDAAGLYQVGSFVGDSWQEWNGRFRDDLRRFVKGDRGTVSKSGDCAYSGVPTSMVTNSENQSKASIS